MCGLQTSPRTGADLQQLLHPWTESYSLINIKHLQSHFIKLLLIATLFYSWMWPDSEYLLKCCGVQVSIIQCLSQARINWEGCSRKVIRHKNGGWCIYSPDGMASRWIAGVSASFIPWWIFSTLSLHHKSRRWRAKIEDVDEGCSKFCVTVGSATVTAGILIHSQLKALAVNLSRPSGWLWLYAGLIGSDSLCWLKADLISVQIFLLPHECKCFFGYCLTWVVLCV